MPPLLKNVIKSTLIGFAVGAIASMLLTPIAGMIFPNAAFPKAATEIVGALGHPAWLGGFVATLNGVTTLATPAFDLLFGDKPTGMQPSEPAQAVSEEPAVTLYLNQEPEAGQAKQCGTCDTNVNVSSLNVNAGAPMQAVATP